MDFRAAFNQGLPYAEYLQRHASPRDLDRWQLSLAQVQLTAEQRALLTGFQRRMNVLCMAGAWCGDCVRQCPIMHVCAEANEIICLRFADRDGLPSLAESLRMMGSPRVPQVVFLSEDFEFVSRHGDRTLSQYRRLAGQLGGAACSSGLVVPGDEQQALVVADWVSEFERAQLVLRLSPKLRDRYGD